MEKIAASHALRDFAKQITADDPMRDTATAQSIAEDATIRADRLLAEAREAEVYFVQGPGGFTETFDKATVDLLVRLGLIAHDHDGYVLSDAKGNGVGPLHHFYEAA